MQQDSNLENIRKLIEMHSLERRHIESERAWFMSVYAAITGGVLAFLTQKGTSFMPGDGTEASWPLYFLIGLTFFGFFLTLRWTYSFECHRERVNELIKLLKLPQTERYSPECLTMTIPTFRLWKFSKFFRTKYWFPLFYLLLLALFSSVFPTPLKYWAIGCSVVAILLGITYLYSKPK